MDEGQMVLMIPIIAIISTFLFLTLTTLAKIAANAYCTAKIVNMKRRALEAGMTAAEIERIVAAGQSNFKPMGKPPVMKPFAKHPV